MSRRRPDVRAPLAVEALGGQLGEGHRLEQPGGMDEHVDAAEGRERSLDDPGRCLVFGDVDGQHDVLRDVGRRGCETFRRRARPGDRRARRAHRPRGRGADARAGARDDRDLAVETQIGACVTGAPSQAPGLGVVDRERVVERLLFERDTVDVAGPLDGHEAGEHVFADKCRLALERIAVTSAAAELVSQELAGLDHFLRDGPQRLLCAVGKDLKGIDAAASPPPRVPRGGWKWPSVT